MALAELAAPDADAGAAGGVAARAARPGELTPRTMAAVIGALLPERAIVVDEALTSGVGLNELTSGAPRHDWLSLTGGAIGDGLPMALGAAVACPDRPVIGIQADGSAMYTISALWTLRPRAGRRHDDRLRQRLVRDPRARAVAGRARPATASGRRSCSTSAARTWTSSRWRPGMGVPATRATTAEELADQLRQALAEPGPHLIDAVLPDARRAWQGVGPGDRTRRSAGDQCFLPWVRLSICEVVVAPWPSSRAASP